MEKQGLNLHLPEANLKEDKLLDKLGLYDKADKDSMKLAEWMRGNAKGRFVRLRYPVAYSQRYKGWHERTKITHSNGLDILAGDVQ